MIICIYIWYHNATHVHIMCVCMYVYIHIYIYTYKYIYTYIYIYIYWIYWHVLGTVYHILHTAQSYHVHFTSNHHSIPMNSHGGIKTALFCAVENGLFLLLALARAEILSGLEAVAGLRRTRTGMEHDLRNWDMLYMTGINIQLG